MRFLFLTLSISSFYSFAQDIEEIIVTGVLQTEVNENSVSAKVLDNDFLDSIDINTFSEISKYLSSSSGSRFQTNSLDGVDQGMSNINLRGLDNTSTLLLLNSNRHTTAGTPSTRGQGYVDANIIPEIAIRRIEVVKESASPQYGSDAVAGVINVLTYDEFDGLKMKLNYQSTDNYDQNNTNIGILYGSDYENGNYVFSISSLNKEPLNASEIPGIAELAVSGLGRSFKVSEVDKVNDGIWKGEYQKNQKIPDPSCIENGGVLVNASTCGFLYGNRFNIVNDEDHLKFYSAVNHNFGKVLYSLKVMYSEVDVNDNPQSPSYPALPFLSRKISPNQGMSPFNVPLTWYGRPLGSEFKSPVSPKDIDQYNLNHTFNFSYDEKTGIKISLSDSKHKNNHYRPDIIDSRFLAALNGNGGIDGNQTWNLFDSSQNPASLIDYVTGAEISTKEARLKSLNIIVKRDISDTTDLAYGFSSNKEYLEIYYEEISRAEFNDNGQLLKTADLFFLGGGKNVSKSRNNKAIFVELFSKINSQLNIRTSARYEDYGNDQSLDPKVTLNYQPNEKLLLRGSISSSFVMPSMAQMFSSEINLGSVRDVDDSSPFVRQALIGNESLKAAEAESINIGLTYEIKAWRVLIDYWKMDFEDRIEIESAQAIINQNPLSSRITRNENGDLIGVTSSYFNEESTEINGFDFSIKSNKDLGKFGEIYYSVDASIIKNFLTPNSDKTKLINRVGKFNYDNHTFSLPEKKINTFLSWEFSEMSFNLNTRYIDGYINEREIKAVALNLGYINKVKSSFMVDISATRKINLKTGKLNIKLSIINLFDKSAPRLYDAPDFSFDTRVHDPRGRIFGVGVEYNH
ncbi:MAG: TonB-dependent receptor plug domain-containing protein [Gammaproteobacteria bacterium]|tara:strand:- start:1679 stop:4246 length:2568 start_codon:yes stop_codon:yes gene_type:complete